MTRATPGLLILVAILSACASTDDDPSRMSVDLISITRENEVTNIHVPVTGSSVPVATRAALPLTATEGAGARTLTTPPVTLPDDARLTFAYAVDPPILIRAAVQIRVRLIDDDSNVAAERTWKIKRSFLRIAWLGLKSRWVFRNLPVDHSRRFRWDISSYAGRHMRFEFWIQAERPDDALVERYEREVGRSISSPFAVEEPRVIGRGAAETQTDRPDVVLFLVDGLRSDFVDGAWGSVHAPSLWRLSVSGMTVERAYAPSNSPRASTAAILAGRPASVIGLPLDERSITSDEMRAHLLLTTKDATPASTVDSLPSLLRRIGYRTYYAHEDSFVENDPLAASFDEAIYFPQSESAVEQIEMWLKRRVAPVRAPKFLVVQVGGLRRSWDEMIARRWVDPLMPESDPRDRLSKAMGRADTLIGKIVNTFETAHHDNPSVIGVVGTHGIDWETGHPLGHGNSLYDGETRVAMIIRRPGFVPVGPRPGPRGAIDLYSTVAELVGAAVPVNIESVSLLNNPGSPGDVTIEAPGQFAVIQGETKFIVKDEPYVGVTTGRPADDGRFEEFYVLSQDTRELRNLAGQRDLISSARDRAWDWRKHLRKVRRGQIRELRRTGIPPSSVYADRAFERIHVSLQASQKPVRFQGVVRCDNGIFTYRRIDDPGESGLKLSSSRTNLYFDVQVPEGRSRQFGFTPWPADAPYELEFFANGEPLPAPSVRFGALRLPIYGNPAKLGGRRDLAVLTATEPPLPDFAQDSVDVWVTPVSTEPPRDESESWTWMTDVVGAP